MLQHAPPRAPNERTKKHKQIRSNSVGGARDPVRGSPETHAGADCGAVRRFHPQLIQHVYAGGEADSSHRRYNKSTADRRRIAP